jgi:Zn-dependent peptidase ImmA (M78 family)/transcriptional regulator with XRE-family HTH domain
MPTSTNIAYINPKIIAWARSRSGVSAAAVHAAVKISNDDLQAWERGDSRPPFDKAQKLAEALGIPFGYLFLSQPPEVTMPIPDLRTLADSEPLSLNFLQVVNDALVKQDWYRDYLIESNESKPQFVGRFNSKSDLDAVARDIRAMLGIDSAFRRSAKDWADYVSKLASRAERAGVLVMRSGVVGNLTRRKLSSREFQGFALSDQLAPLVFVNSDDFKSAQVFTLIHELAHTWIGTSAISHIDPTKPKPGDSSVETFCNRVAAEVLVPRTEFNAAWKSIDIETLANQLARQFWVSTLVILRRAFELDKISATEFFEHIELERKKIKRSTNSGGNYYRNVIARMGTRFTRAVYNDALSGRLLFRDAARLLQLNVPTLLKLGDYLG